MSTSTATPSRSEAPPRASSRLRLGDYYAIEAINSVAATLIGSAVYFWARHRHGYTDIENQLVGAAFGLAYAVGARWGGMAADRFGLDRALRWALALLAPALGLGWLIPQRWAPLALLIYYGFLVAPTWTALEGAVSHARSPLSSARRVGIYNVVWSAGNALSMLAAGALLRWRADAVIWGAGALHAAGWLWTLRRSASAADAEGGASDAVTSAVPQPPAVAAAHRRRRLMELSLLGNGLAYLLQWVLFALLPGLAERREWSASYAVWLTLGFFVARSLAFAALSSWKGWHDHPAWSHGALWAAPMCVALFFAVPHPAAAFGALGALGAAVGVTYYGSIYYTLEAGRAKGTQGGIHEAVIGLGGGVGPLIGAALTWGFGDARPALYIIVGIAFLLNGLGSLGIYRRARCV